MIIACPACATRYAVPDNAIGIEGRTVRCAKCRHAWFQEGPGQPELAMPEPAIPEPAIPEPAAPANEPAVSPPIPQPVVPEPAAVAAAPVEPEPPLHHEAPRAPRLPTEVAGQQEDIPSSFAHEPPFRPRRNPAKMWMAAAIAFALAVGAAIAAVAWFGLPSWVPMAQATFSAETPDLKLDFPANRQERRPLPNGTDFFNVSGTITNIGQQRRKVPVLLIVLRDRHNRIVYTVEAAPPRTDLAPGESETINQAIIDAPKSARAAEIGWKPD